ncbi:MAG: M23 family metallopeptidase [Anaerolineales bacterium]|nr:M23 family metallopeptidase [Anaerolineales bacterium]
MKQNLVFGGLLVLLVLLFLAACQAAPTAAPSPTAAPATDTPLPPTATPTVPPPTATEAPAEPTATQIPQPVLCSPLKDHDIYRLRTYVSNAYATPATSNKEEGHHGVDFAYYYKDGDGAPILGIDIQAIAPGRIAAMMVDKLPYGNMVMIETPYEMLAPELIAYFGIGPETSFYHLYAHMLNPPEWNVGDLVNCGQTLGQVGNTGFSGNEHLHLETRTGPANYDFSGGLAYYSTAASDVERGNYELWRSSGTFVHFDPIPFFEVFFPPGE